MWFIRPAIAIQLWPGGAAGQSNYTDGMNAWKIPLFPQEKKWGHKNGIVAFASTSSTS